ncbi:hypothetical protein MUG91_G257n14 [Manis pentadactyla]|nr:hypothetical protein MUG91_G257n14 [Manis pentadactyla]
MLISKSPTLSWGLTAALQVRPVRLGSRRVSCRNAGCSVQYHEYSDPSERTASQHGSNKGAVLLLLSSRT